MINKSLKIIQHVFILYSKMATPIAPAPPSIQYMLISKKIVSVAEDDCIDEICTTVKSQGKITYEIHKSYNSIRIERLLISINEKIQKNIPNLRLIIIADTKNRCEALTAYVNMITYRLDYIPREYEKRKYAGPPWFFFFKYLCVLEYVAQALIIDSPTDENVKKLRTSLIKFDDRVKLCFQTIHEETFDTTVLCMEMIFKMRQDANELSVGYMEICIINLFNYFTKVHKYATAEQLQKMGVLMSVCLPELNRYCGYLIFSLDADVDLIPHYFIAGSVFKFILDFKYAGQASDFSFSAGLFCRKLISLKPHYPKVSLLVNHFTDEQLPTTHHSWWFSKYQSLTSIWISRSNNNNGSSSTKKKQQSPPQQQQTTTTTTTMVLPMLQRLLQKREDSRSDSTYLNITDSPNQ